MEENNNLTNTTPQTEGKTVFCHKCGTECLDTDTFCKGCGTRLKSVEQDDNDDTVRCPNCGSANVQFVTYQASSNFDKGDACCGYLLCGPIGLLFGAKDKTEAKTVRKCKKCEHEF